LHSVFVTAQIIRGIIEEIEVNKIKPSSILVFSSDRLDVQELISSIQQKGLLQPIIVRMMRGDSFEVVAGMRRYNACKSLGWKKLLCHIVELDDKEAFEFALTENIQRKTVDPLEEAQAFKAYVQDFGWGGISELATKISKSPSYVCKRLSLLKLSAEILQGIQSSLISPTVAEELIPLQNEERQLIAKLVVQKKISSREVRRLVNKRKILNSFELTSEDAFFYQNNIVNLNARAQRSFDKSITTLKIAMSKMATIIENVEDNWIVYEILMQHKNMLNSQIDLLIKEKKKL
jgi:ParB family chromosome partitioning protein